MRSDGSRKPVSPLSDRHHRRTWVSGSNRLGMGTNQVCKNAIIRPRGAAHQIKVRDLGRLLKISVSQQTSARSKDTQKRRNKPFSSPLNRADASQRRVDHHCIPRHDSQAQEVSLQLMAGYWFSAKYVFMHDGLGRLPAC